MVDAYESRAMRLSLNNDTLPYAAIRPNKETTMKSHADMNRPSFAPSAQLVALCAMPIRMFSWDANSKREDQA